MKSSHKSAIVEHKHKRVNVLMQVLSMHHKESYAIGVVEECVIGFLTAESIVVNVIAILEFVNLVGLLLPE